MGLKRFDKKFGAEFLQGLPTTPAVYLFKDELGEVLYAGKARNIRRRLGGGVLLEVVLTLRQRAQR